MKYLRSGPSKSVYKPKGRSEAGKERQELYASKEWKALRKKHITAMPWCEHCLIETGESHRGWAVDHIRGHSDPNWRENFFNPANLQTLCERHHNIKTKKERPMSGQPTTPKPRLTKLERAELLRRR